jgi:guanylate kinase
LLPEAVLIYISAESEEALVQRLRERKTEPEGQLKMRIATARQEVKRLEMFDYIVINAADKLDQTCHTIAAIIKAEKCRVNPRKITL